VIALVLRPLIHQVNLKEVDQEVEVKNNKDKNKKNVDLYLKFS
jgi:hypothetical protein